MTSCWQIRCIPACRRTCSGMEQIIDIGPMSGKSNVLFWLERHGMPATDEMRRPHLPARQAERPHVERGGNSRVRAPSGDGEKLNSRMAVMRHAILGAGGVGGLIGACLANRRLRLPWSSGRKRWRNIREQLHLESAFGNFSVPVSRAAEVPPLDVLWITVKATQLDAALPVDHQAAIGRGDRSAAERHRSSRAACARRYGAEQSHRRHHRRRDRACRAGPHRPSHSFARLNVLIRPASSAWRHYRCPSEDRLRVPLHRR